MSLGEGRRWRLDRSLATAGSGRIDDDNNTALPSLLPSLPALPRRPLERTILLDSVLINSVGGRCWRDWVEIDFFIALPPYDAPLSLLSRSSRIVTTLDFVNR